jgi:DNA polymerase IIIc chi subunit
MTSSKVIFIPIKDNAAKLQAITTLAYRYFTGGTRMLFCVASDEAARYVDELLWKLPPESFLPHAILTQPSSEAIGITTGLVNLNEATVLFNLRPEANPLANAFSVTYEYLDETHPDKLKQSLERKNAYLKQGLEVSDATAHSPRK